MVEPSGPREPVPPTSAPTPGRAAPTAPPRAPGRAQDPLAQARERFSTAKDPLAGSKEWPAQAADLIVDKVDLVKTKTTGPILTVARGAVFGLIAVVLGVMAAILLLIGVVRGLDNVIPSSVWATYLVLGVLFTLVGTLLFRRRKTPGLAGPTGR